MKSDQISSISYVYYSKSCQKIKLYYFIFKPSEKKKIQLIPKSREQRRTIPKHHPLPAPMYICLVYPQISLPEKKKIKQYKIYSKPNMLYNFSDDIYTNQLQIRSNKTSQFFLCHLTIIIHRKKLIYIAIHKSYKYHRIWTCVKVQIVIMEEMPVKCEMQFWILIFWYSNN